MQPRLPRTLPLPFASVVGTFLTVMCPWGCHCCPKEERQQCGTVANSCILQIWTSSHKNPSYPRLCTQHSVATVGNSENQEKSLPVLMLNTHIAEWLWTLRLHFPGMPTPRLPWLQGILSHLGIRQMHHWSLGEEDDIKAWASQLYILGMYLLIRRPGNQLIFP